MSGLSRGFSVLVCLILLLSALPIVAQIQHGVPWQDASAASASAPAGAHLSYFGGPVISNAHIVQVLYGTGSYNPQVAGTSSPTMGNFFGDILGTNSGYINLLSQYSTNVSGGTNQSIGNGTFDGRFQITPSAANNGSTIDDSNIQAELLAQINAGHLPAPVLDPAGNVNTLYMIYFPPGKTITAGGSTSCVAGGFCAYHGTTSNTLNSKHFLYGVMPDMQAGSGCSTGCGASSVFGNYTSVTSHELSETITDAEVGIASSIAAPLAWYDPNNGEIGDICNGQQGLYAANGTTYTIQLEFSNAANNCVLPPPAPTGSQCSINGLSTTTGLVADTSNGSLWAAISGGNYVLHFDDGCNIINTVFVGRYPFGIAWDGTYIWVSNYEDNTVTKISSSTSAIVGTYPVGSHPRAVIVVGNYVFVANQGSNTVTKLDQATGALLKTIQVGSQPYSLASGGLGGLYFFVGNTGSNTVMQIDLNGNILQTIATPSDPSSIGIGYRSSDSKQILWVSCYNGATIDGYVMTTPITHLGTLNVSQWGHPEGIVGIDGLTVARVVTHSGYFLDIQQAGSTNNLLVNKAIALETGTNPHLFNIILIGGTDYWIDDVDRARIFEYTYPL